MDHPRPWLKYVAVKDLEDRGDLENMKVRGATVNNSARSMGSSSTKPQPVRIMPSSAPAAGSRTNISSSQWVTSTLNGPSLVADLTRERAKRIPGFDKGEFERMSTDDVKRMNAELATACSLDGVTIVAAAWDAGDHYRAPDWWKESYYRSPVGDRP